jgi:transposase-like protein
MQRFESGSTIVRVREYIPVTCPYCGEEGDLDVDETGASRQSYVQDCPVCCQPWQVELTRDRDGEWNAALRTGDE